MDLHLLPKSVVRLFAVMIIAFGAARVNAGAISGTVQNSQGKPLVDVVVSLVENSQTRNPTIAPSGIYMIEPPSRYRKVTLLYEKPGFVSRCAFDVENKNQLREPIVLLSMADLSRLSPRALSSVIRELEQTTTVLKDSPVNVKLERNLSQVTDSVDRIARNQARKKDGL